jgi:hypothetical protein
MSIRAMVLQNVSQADERLNERNGEGLRAGYAENAFSTNRDS